MQLTRDGKLIRTDIWREGEYLDLWSVPHFLSGMAVAFTLYFFGFATNAAFIIAFLLLVAYEMFEVIAEIEETRWNRILDVVVGMVSFTPTFLLAPNVPQVYAVGAFILVVAVDSVLSYFGWLASHKASALETKLRAEFEKEKQRFAHRKLLVRAKWDGRQKRWRARASRSSETTTENA
ncbi:MAG: hypothetical protein WAZ27_04890 [Minisyncoccia bacterium]